METIVFSGEAFAALLAYIFAVPIAAKVALKDVALDTKLDPEEGEDETRLGSASPKKLHDMPRRESGARASRQPAAIFVIRRDS